MDRYGFIAGRGHVHEPPGFHRGGHSTDRRAFVATDSAHGGDDHYGGKHGRRALDGHAVAKDGLGTTTATAGSCEWSTGLSKRPSPSLIQRRSPTFSSASAHRQSHDAYRE